MSSVTTNVEAVEQGAGGFGRFVVTLFLLSMATPLVFHVGSMRFEPYRLVLVLGFIPLLLAFVSGKAGRLRFVDAAMLSFASYNVISMLLKGPLERAIEFSGIQFIELLGAYLLGRVLVRSREDFYRIALCLTIMLILFIPLGAYESLTGHRPIRDILRGITENDLSARDLRWGMHRAMVSFPHPILYGLFCSIGIGFLFYTFSARRGPSRGVAAMILSVAAMFWGLSSGPFLAAATQIGLTIYDKTTRFLWARWHLLTWGLVSLYLFLSVASDRGPIVILMDNLTFNPISTWARIHQWENGMESLAVRPMLGFGFEPWRLDGSTNLSIDNYFLATAMLNGIPAALLILLTMISYIVTLSSQSLRDPELDACRKAILFPVLGIMVAMCTVYLWGSIVSLTFFLIGAGMWLVDAPDNEGVAPPPPAKTEPAKRAAIGAQDASSPPPRRNGRPRPAIG